jgi:hypothetical protein
VAAGLLSHYLDGGGPAAIEWAYFSGDARFVEWAHGLSEGESQLYRAPWNSDMFRALGTFTVTRTDDNYYVIKDRYDYRPDKPANWIYVPLWLREKWGEALEFDVEAGGALPWPVAGGGGGGGGW